MISSIRKMISIYKNNNQNVCNYDLRSINRKFWWGVTGKIYLADFEGCQSKKIKHELRTASHGLVWRSRCVCNPCKNSLIQSWTPCLIVPSVIELSDPSCHYREKYSNISEGKYTQLGLYCAFWLLLALKHAGESSIHIFQKAMTNSSGHFF